uniref:Uncharacterized protein n=1 Tax=Rhizophora mucronata TaxID=61149 RepID=A0A2P2PM50_RHIMU
MPSSCWVFLIHFSLSCFYFIQSTYIFIE